MTKLEEAIQILKEGGVGIFPTDTAFGIGCRIDSEKAVKRLFTIRRRPHTQATPVLVSSLIMASYYFSFPLPDNVRRLCERYWPGGLTVVYRCKTEKVPSLVRGGGITLGLRMPDHDIPLQLLEAGEVPLLAPSANFHGEKTPYNYRDLDRKLIKQVDFVLEGKCKGVLASTVVDCTKSPFHIMRQGAVELKL